MSEDKLDKFKRRLIRTAARLLLHEKQPEEQVWDALRKESGCDCKLLWQRMRALALKKLDRLLAADDQVDAIAAVARLTPTDWLLVDLVLVHEPVDLIGTKLKSKKDGTGWSKDPPALWELFSLVQTFGIETPAKPKNAEDTRRVAEAWTGATAYYNKTKSYNKAKNQSCRRQCSAMLMQRRWYQLKESTRNAFYRLWGRYRGNSKAWEECRGLQPTDLQIAIAKRYPHVVTQPFQDWEDQVKAGLVILPKEFEDRVRNPPKAPPNASSEGNDPDLEVLEPVIETIELNDSDSEETDTNQAKEPGANNTHLEDENSNSNSNGSGLMLHDGESCEQDTSNRNTTDPNDGLSNVKILETTHIPVQKFSAEGIDPNVKVKIEPEDPTDPAVKRRNLSIEMSKFLESTQNEVDPPETGVDDSLTDDLIKKKAQEYLSHSKNLNTGQTNDTDLTLDEDITEDNTAVNLIHEDITEVNTAEDLIQERTDAYVSKSNRLPDRTVSVESSDVSDENEISPEQLIQEKTNALLYKSKTSVNTVPEITATSNIDGELDNADSRTSDDLIKAKADEYVQKKRDPNPEPISPEETPPSENEEDFYDDIIKQKADEFVREADLKKLTSDVNTDIDKSATIDLLEGMEIVDDGIEYFEEDDDCGTVVKAEPECEQTDAGEQEESASFDLKLLMDPVVYTLKLDHMSVFSHTSFESVANIDTIEEVIKESKPVSKKSVKDIQNVSLGSDHLSQSTVDDNNQEQLDNDPVNHDSVDDSGESDDEINEDLKVKPSSYLLQKPRTRSYNPIQLCKNPDFNTRLRRLTVGFFASGRNRQLLKACKPMTIDLNKAFESKLLNGTLYLKTDNVTKTPSNEVETQPEHAQTVSTSVVPSATPIQSLIDNAIENYLEKQSPIPTVDLTMKSKGERSKKINLKDINEIRRINEKLATAQVTPIRIDDYVAQTTNDKDKEKTPEENSNNPPAGNRRPSASSTPNEIPNCEITNKRKFSSGRPHLMNLVIASMTSGRYEPVPWNKPKKKPTSKIDDFLITIDTLNKIINKMDGHEEPPGKHKKINWVVNRNDTGSKNQLCSTSKQQGSQNPQKTNAVTTKSYFPEKKTVISYCCWAAEKLEKMDHKNKNRRVNAKHNCARVCTCCCREALLEAYASCSASKRSWLLTTQPALAASIDLDATIDLDDDELDNACRAIEEGVHNSAECSPKAVFRVKAGITAAPPRRFFKSLSETGSARGFPMSVSAVHDSRPRYISISSRETSTRLVLNDPPEHHFISVQTHPVLKLDVATQTDGDGTTFELDEAVQSMEPKLKITIKHCDPSEMPLISEMQTGQQYNQNENTNMPNVQNKTVIGASPSKIGPVQSKIVIDASRSNFAYAQNQIVIDPSSSDIVPNVQIVKRSPTKEKMMYLSSNCIAQQPSGSPIYLGQNKILLTTVKFPKNLDKGASETSPSKAAPVPPLVPCGPSPNIDPSALTLPAGVQLVLPATGELTYVLDPGVVLDAGQLESLSQIMEIVKTQISAAAAPTTAQSLPCDEVVNLSDDENVKNDQPECTLVAESTKNADSAPTNLIPDTQSRETLVSDDGVPNDENISNSQQDSDAVAQTSNQEAEIQTPPSVHADEVVNMSDNENASNEPLESGPAPNSEAISEKQMLESTETAPLQPETAPLVQEPSVDNETTELNSNNGSGVVIVDDENKAEGTTACQEATNDSNDENNSRNLLMDLMEMSGISAEDTRPAPQELTPVTVTSQPASLTSTPVVQFELPELTPVTSLAELKYACEHNGKFFKLDVKTGALVRINVCIKKNVKAKKVGAPSFYVPTLSVIDLTDENESNDAQIKKDLPLSDLSKKYLLPRIVPKAPPMPSTDKTAVISNLYRRSGLKPPKIIQLKTQRPGPACSKRKLETSAFAIPAKADRTEIRRILRPARKQNLQRIEARIDMVDSDTPLEEEYLESDSDDDEFKPPPYLKYHGKRVYAAGTSLLKPVEESTVAPVAILSDTDQDVELSVPIAVIRNPNAEDDYSSDDEPLAKKVKRKAAVDTVISTALGAIEPTTEGPGDDDSEINVPESVDDAPLSEDGEDMDLDMENSFVPTFIENDADEEDCILGV